MYCYKIIIIIIIKFAKAKICHSSNYFHIYGGIYNSCGEGEYAFMVLPKYSIIFLKEVTSNIAKLALVGRDSYKKGQLSNTCCPHFPFGILPCTDCLRRWDLLTSYHNILSNGL